MCLGGLARDSVLLIRLLGNYDVTRMLECPTKSSIRTELERLRERNDNSSRSQ